MTLKKNRTKKHCESTDEEFLQHEEASAVKCESCEYYTPNSMNTIVKGVMTSEV